MPGVVILGSTGSIGQQSLQVMENLRTRGYELNLVGITAHTNWDKLQKQKETFQPQLAVLTGREKEERNGFEYGREALLELVVRDDVDIVINGLVGISGLEPSLAALKAGKKLALANKESLVTGGPLISRLLDRPGSGEIVPVDSEHSAIYQLLRGYQQQDIASLVLTASGGPFLYTPREEMKEITPEKALQHPTWTMGGKISIDSATLMNKALEVIEAHWLFGVDYDKIEVLVHPESIIHSLVRLQDGALLAHLGEPDMRVPIQYALTGPHHVGGEFGRLDLACVGRLNFSQPRWADFPALELGYEAGRRGDSMPVVFNGANEAAVTAFLEGRISFLEIASTVGGIMAAHDPFPLTDLEAVLAADRWARQKFEEEVG